MKTRTMERVPSNVSAGPGPAGPPKTRVAPRLNVAQMVRQAARLAEVRPELVAAYQVALRRW